jgi:hypothetical protein
MNEPWGWEDDKDLLLHLLYEQLSLVSEMNLVVTLHRKSLDESCRIRNKH